MLVEFEGDEPQEIRQQMRGMIDAVQQQARLAFGSRQAFDQEETELFLNLPNRAMPLLYRLKGPSRPVPVVEDVSVPPEVLPDFLVRTQNVLKRRQVTASLLCHAGHGQIAHPAVSRPGRSQRRAADAAHGGRAVRRGLQRRRHDRRRTGLRTKPHAVLAAAGRSAL